MTRKLKTALFASVPAAILLLGAGQGFAAESGDFQATLRGATIGVPLGAAPPPGLYFGLETFIGINNPGTGVNSAAAGAVPVLGTARGLTVFGQAYAASLVWGTGWKFLGGDVTFAVIQPGFTVAGFATNPVPPPMASCTPPMNFGCAGGSFFENLHNTVWSSSLSWNLGAGWFGSAGFDFQGPDGSQYNGTLNQDYWTFSPHAAVAYFSKEWKIAVNSEYDIHTASAGHTGTFAAIAANAGLVPTATNVGAPGIGYRGGDQLFVDWSAEYKLGKWAFGPVGYFKFQTTTDTPGSGFTCATLAATFGPSLGCSKPTAVALGGILEYDLGPANFQIWVTNDELVNNDDFKGWSVWTRLSLKLWGPEAPPPAPLIHK